MKRQMKKLTDIKIDNINQIFDIIRENDGIIRGKIASLSGLSIMSITRIVSAMINNKFVYEEGEIFGSAGRPSKMLHINTGIYYTMTVLIDVDMIKIAIVDLNNMIVMQSQVNANDIGTMNEYVDITYDEFQDMMKGYDNIRENIACISIVCPGVIDQSNGEIIISAQLKWRNVKIVDYTYRKFEITTIIDNDVKSALMGELTIDRRYRDTNVAYMDIGYGIGVGLWIGGQVLRGVNNRAGEIGHMVIDYNGIACECGKTGCLNTVLNIKSIIDRARQYDDSIISINDIVEKSKEDVEWTKVLFDDVCMYASIAVNSIICSYDPSIIRIGGKFISQTEGVLDIVSSLKHYGKFVDLNIEADLEVSTLKDKAYIIGGAINSQKLLIEKIFI